MSRKRKSRNGPAMRSEANQRRPVRLWIITSIAVIVGAAAVVYLMARWRTTDPPIIETRGIDPAIARAIQSARRDVIESPRDANAWGMLGMTLLAHDFTTPAETCFAEASRFNQSDVRWPYLRARCLERVDPELTKSLLEHCVTLDGSKRGNIAHLFLIELLLEENQLDAAESHLNDVLSRDPDNARARHAQARLRFLKGDYRACKDGILAFLNGVRDQYESTKSRVKSLMQQGRQDEAKLKLDAANKWLHHELSRQKSLSLLLVNALRELGESENAIKQRQIAEKQTDNPWPDPIMKQVGDLRTGLKMMLTNADLAYAAKRYDESISILQDAIAQYPDSVFAQIRLGRAYIRTARIAQTEHANKQRARKRCLKASQHLRQAVTLDPNSVEAQFRLAVSLVDLAQLDNDREPLKEAETWYRKAISVKPDFTMAHFNLADCLDRQGRLDQAIDAMRGTIRCEPNHVQGRVAMGKYLLRAGRPSAAEKHLQVAVQLDPENEIAKKLLSQLESRMDPIP